LKEYGPAIDDFTSAITCAKPPNDQWIYSDRAKTFEKIGRYREAIADFTECIQPKGQVGTTIDWSFYASRGGDFQRIQQWQQSISDYSDAIKRMSWRKELEAVYENRAKAYVELGQSDLAAADKLSAKQATPHKPDSSNKETLETIANRSKRSG